MNKHREISYKWRKENPEKTRAIDRQKYLRHREKILARAKEYYQANKEKIRARDVKYMYGISLEEAKALLTKPCRICGEPSRDIDHCHTTKKVRGALCRKCNLGLGYFNDNSELLSKAVEYLKS